VTAAFSTDAVWYVLGTRTKAPNLSWRAHLQLVTEAWEVCPVHVEQLAGIVIRHVAEVDEGGVAVPPLDSRQELIQQLVVRVTTHTPAHTTQHTTPHHTSKVSAKPAVPQNGQSAFAPCLQTAQSYCY
jgi:hypothetical protein